MFDIFGEDFWFRFFSFLIFYLLLVIILKLIIY